LTIVIIIEIIGMLSFGILMTCKGLKKLQRPRRRTMGTRVTNERPRE